jgi:hypothetical protein
VWMLHCCDEFARKEDMLVEINAGLGDEGLEWE